MQISPNSNIAELRRAMELGLVTSTELVHLYLNRIAAYDRSGLTANAVPIINPEVFAHARAADAERAAGGSLGPLHGIPFVIKDSFSAEGLTVASGSPAFAELIAMKDAASVEFLRSAGAVLIGKTTMPPMAAGGMQKGVYGRAVSPYNPEYMPAAWVSGSSNGSGVAVAASFASFGLGEETLSSGRSPASNCGLVAYTPSRGMISIRGNWPLLALRDVVVPYTRTVDDMLEILNVLVREDEDTAGDLWRAQTEVTLPAVDDVRPADFRSIAQNADLAGTRIGIPRLFIGKDTSIAEPIELRESVRRLWDAAEEDLRRMGAEVVEVEPPVFAEFDKLIDTARDIVDRGYWDAEFVDLEFSDLAGAGWQDFLQNNANPEFDDLSQVDFNQIFPEELYGLGPEVNPMPRVGIAEIRDGIARARQGSLSIAEGRGVFAGLERFRTELLEDWMDEHGIDLLAFPAASDVAPADSDVSLTSIVQAWKPGAGFSIGGWCFRPLGLPSVIVPMGVMHDTGMPVGITFTGKAYSDPELLAAAYAYEQHTGHREEPVHAPIAPGEVLRIAVDSAASEHNAPQTSPHDAPQVSPHDATTDGGAPRATTTTADGGESEIVVEVLGFADDVLSFIVRAADGVEALTVTVDGVRVAGVEANVPTSIDRAGGGIRTGADGVQGGLIIASARSALGGPLGAYAEFDVPQTYRGPSA